MESIISYEVPELVDPREQMARLIHEFLIENNLGDLEGAALEQFVNEIHEAIARIG